MQKVKNIQTTLEVQPLSRFIGDKAELLISEIIDVSRHVSVQVMELSYIDVDLPEEKGCLYFYPIDDGKYCLQLLYLKHSDQPGNVAVVYHLTFFAGFFEQYDTDMLMANKPFRTDHASEQLFQICSQAQLLLPELSRRDAHNHLLQALHLSETTTHLLRRALQSVTVPFAACQVPACRFLAIDSEREKIYEARTYIEQNLTVTFTIRELSRKVAMNECYLKKGFKTLVGKTIHEYQQYLRIENARKLLQEQGQTVTDVAATLGFSSISHFSTAFKKATGMKPCELLK